MDIPFANITNFLNTSAQKLSGKGQELTKHIISDVILPVAANVKKGDVAKAATDYIVGNGKSLLAAGTATIDAFTGNALSNFLKKHPLFKDSFDSETDAEVNVALLEDAVNAVKKDIAALESELNGLTNPADKLDLIDRLNGMGFTVSREVKNALADDYVRQKQAINDANSQFQKKQKELVDKISETNKTLLDKQSELQKAYDERDRVKNETITDRIK